MTVDRAESPPQPLRRDSASYWARDHLRVSGDWSVTDGHLATLATIPDATPRPINGSGSTGIARRPTKFRPRRYQRSPDRQRSRYRRRGLACNYGHMPEQVRNKYTEALAAVLAVFAIATQTHGYCDWHVDAIAAMVGVCRSTVINARREAVRLGHITWTERRVPGRKNKTNIIRIVSPEWVAWIQRGPKRGPATGCKTEFLCPAKISRFKKERTPTSVRSEGSRASD